MVRIDISIQALQPLPSGQVVICIEVNGEIEGCPDSCVDWSATVLADSWEDGLTGMKTRGKEAVLIPQGAMTRRHIF